MACKGLWESRDDLVTKDGGALREKLDLLAELVILAEEGSQECQSKDSLVMMESKVLWDLKD